MSDWKFKVGNRIKIKDRRRDMSSMPQQSKDFYGPEGYYPEFGIISELWEDSGYKGYLVQFENPVHHQTTAANVVEENLELAV